MYMYEAQSEILAGPKHTHTQARTHLRTQARAHARTHAHTQQQQQQQRNKHNSNNTKTPKKNRKQNTNNNCEQRIPEKTRRKDTDEILVKHYKDTQPNFHHIAVLENFSVDCTSTGSRHEELSRPLRSFPGTSRHQVKRTQPRSVDLNGSCHTYTAPSDSGQKRSRSQVLSGMHIYIYACIYVYAAFLRTRSPDRRIWKGGWLELGYWPARQQD